MLSSRFLQIVNFTIKGKTDEKNLNYDHNICDKTIYYDRNPHKTSLSGIIIPCGVPDEEGNYQQFIVSDLTK